jgi:hypothetical protein
MHANVSGLQGDAAKSVAVNVSSSALHTEELTRTTILHSRETRQSQKMNIIKDRNMIP